MEFKYKLGQMVKHVTTSKYMEKPFVVISRLYFEEQGSNGVNSGYAYRVRNEFSTLVEWYETEIEPCSEADKD